MAEAAGRRMVRCAYSPQCINSFPARGPKKYCCAGHRVKASHKRTGRHAKGDPVRLAAIERDGGCVRRLLVTEEYLALHNLAEGEIMYVDSCSEKLLVRRIDPTLPRTLGNLQTLCGRHFGMVSDERYRERIGPVRYRDVKKAQARQYYRYRAMRRKSVRIYRGPPKNLLDYIDYI